MNIQPKCTCNGGPDLMFCCSGAADTAEQVADAAARLRTILREALTCA
jgi:uncharacterized metal-binding protein